MARKPAWIRVKLPTGSAVSELKGILREQGLHTVCEEASCPNIGECFSKGTATFMIMGDKCTRRCPFCDVAHGRPDPLDPDEPGHLARTVARLDLRYVVVTSVDRDDLRDGGAAHFAACINAIREHCPQTRIEVLVPDFRGRMDPALEIFAKSPPDVFNHNLETVPRLYRSARPGSDYAWSLRLIQRFKSIHPHVPTKSGVMLGLGETREEILVVLQDLRAHNCDMLTLGQYLQPSRYHLAVEKFWQSLGSRTLRLSPEAHDSVVARTSHLPHVLATALVRTVLGGAKNGEPDFCATGFHDTTRLADGSAPMWRDIALANPDAIADAVADLQAELDGLRNALDQKDAAALEEFFAEGQSLRAEWMRRRD